MLEYIEVHNDSASAKIALQGAHVFHYARNGEVPILWLSESSDFQDGKAIRGGVPICWPSFGSNNPDLPQHGFARTALFKHIETLEIDKDTTQVILRLRDSKESLKLWAYRFELELKVTISDSLTMELTTTNLDTKEFKITQALHSYFSVSDISDVEIKGLNAKPYFDALSSQQCIQDGDISFEKEVDRVYQEVDKVNGRAREGALGYGEVVLKDSSRTIGIKNNGSSSVVVWNPWIDKCKRMSAMSDDAYKEFVCIESSNAFDDFKIIKPNQKHTLKATIY